MRKVSGYELHAITTGMQEPEQVAEIAKAIHPFITGIHLREKMRSARELMELVELLLEKKVPLHKIRVNDRVDVALGIGVGGIHLAGHSLPMGVVKRICRDNKLVIGASVHSMEEAHHAEYEGADYVMYGHVFATESKPGVPPRGLAGLTEIVSGVSVPVIAIGGVEPGNVSGILKAGASGIAVRNGIMEAPDPLRAAKLYAEALHSGSGEWNFAEEGK